MKTAVKDFKMTELGPIPKDWEVKRLGECCSKVNNGFAYDVGVRGKYAITRIETISKGWINLDHVGWCKDCPGDTYLLAPGDVLYSHINSLPYIGNCAQFRGGAILYHGMNLLVLRPDNSVDADYFFKVMSSEPLRRVARTIAKVAINQASINTHDLKDVCLALPPIPEQRKIAAALSDVDEMIAALEKLIEKKRKIKTGAMQRLLTGKTRLPGFKGAWVEKRLGEVVEMCTNTIAINQINVREYVGTENMLSNRQGVKEFDEQLPYVNVREYRCGDILISNIRPYLKKIWLSDRAGGCSTDVLVLRSKEEGVASSFLYSVLCDDSFFDFVMANAVGTKMPRGDKKVIVDYVLYVPPTLAEQKAIAKVFGDMDEEIAALEAELAKIRQLKQGMMQELLTGKTRLA